MGSSNTHHHHLFIFCNKRNRTITVFIIRQHIHFSGLPFIVLPFLSLLYLALLLIWSGGVWNSKRVIFLLFQEFLDDYELFKNTVRDLDLRLSSIVMQAFDDCAGLEGIFKASILVCVQFKLLNN